MNDSFLNMSISKSGPSLGLDIGSTTAKLIVLSASGELLFAAYERHLSEPRVVLSRLLVEASQLLPGLKVRGACTGSGGIALAKGLGLEFVQEVIASTTAVQEIIPHTSVAIELGGEDAKITFFEGNIEQRMNETCAGGTGAFIDQMASYLQTDAMGLNELAKEYTTLYPIASRCGVFAKTDVLPLLNEGAARENIAASIFQAVVDQTVGGLACGRAIKGNVAFLGGPLYFLSELRKRFEESLALTPEQSIFPPNAQYFVAMGAALEVADNPKVPEISLAELAKISQELGGYSGFETEPLPPLFNNQADLDEFKSRHQVEVAPRKPVSEALGPLYLGFDAGSTTIKAVLINEDGEILHTYYANNKGVPLDSAVKVLKEIYNLIPNGAYIAHAGATGYGAGLLKAALGVEVDEVETVAHYRAANFLRPNVSFVLDIGGQDMKCLHVRDGIIDRIMLNEACSAGCGVFIETFAQSLGMGKEEFASRALTAKAPVDLGSRCTVFMNSKIKQAQKEGATVEDIAAGLAYSVIRNALYKVIKVSGPEDLGEVVVAQGGSFLNDALLRAFEILLGRQVFRPDIAGLMGAYGVALIAKERAHFNEHKERSTLISIEDLNSFNHRTKTTRCRLCGNSCLLTINLLPNSKYITGNRCERGGADVVESGRKQDPVNLYARKYQLLFSSYTPLPLVDAPRGEIGIPRVLNMYDRYPYWFTFFTNLGFRVELSSPSSKDLYAKGIDTISSQSVCYPAKLAHGHILDLVERGVKHIFYPCIPREEQEDETADDCYNCPVVSGYPEVLRLNMEVLNEQGVTLHCPFLQMGKSNNLLTRLLEELAPFGVSRREILQALDAAEIEQKNFRAEIRRLGEDALLDLEQTGKLGVVLVGHPYHLDPAVNHGIPELIISSGAAVFTEDSIAHFGQVPRPLRVLDQWPYHSRMFRAASVVAAHPNLELIQFNSFGCGLDAVSAEQVQEILESSNKIHTLLKIDEGANLGGARIRIRSLLATVEEVIAPAGSVQGKLENPAKGQFAKAMLEDETSKSKMIDPEDLRSTSRLAGKNLAVRGIKPLPSLPPLYQNTKFTRAMGETYTILVPQMSPVHFQFLETVMREEGYNVELLPFASPEDVEEGLRYVNNDACYPAIVVIGQLMRAVRSGKYDANKTALLISQTGGSCRATNYVGLLRRGMKKCGMTHVPVISFNMVGLEEQDGFVVSGRMLRRVIVAALYGDMIDKLTLRTRPYELNPGETNKMAEKWGEICKESVKSFSTQLFKKNIKGMLNDFSQIPISDEEKPRVGMVGEILIKYHPDANNQTIQIIESEGGEAVPTELANFILYCLYDDLPFSRHLSTGIIAAIKNWVSIWWIEKQRNIIRKAIARYPRYGHIPTIHELATACREVISLGHQGGEGWLLTAEMLEMLKTGVPNILCMQPFACLPNHITGKGVIRELSRRYPYANIAPVDYDPGASEVNQLNRIKLMMTVAKQNMQKRVA